VALFVDKKSVFWPNPFPETMNSSINLPFQKRKTKQTKLKTALKKYLIHLNAHFDFS